MSINEMQSGPEKDALIAERVMGWTLTELGWWYENGNPTNKMHYPPHPCYATCSNEYFLPSTKITSAWEVVVKLGEIGYTVHIEWKGSDRVYAGTAEVNIVEGIYTVGHGVGTFPEAVCNAVMMVLKLERYFLIIGNHINYPMGCCTIQGVKDVHNEEPEAKFYEISKEEFDSYGDGEKENKYPKDKNWLKESIFYDEIV